MGNENRRTGITKVEDCGNMTFELSIPRQTPGFPELHWTGKRPFVLAAYLPAEKKESYGDSVNGWMNRIYWGDNLQVMSHLLMEFKGKVDLVYIDPPFNSRSSYKKTISLRGKNGRRDLRAFEEKQYTDTWTHIEYIQFIYERLVLIRELLSEHGALYVHCDYRVNWMIRAACEEIFGQGNMINEIIWHYTGGGRSKNYFSRKHDSILAYRKTDKYIFNRDAVRVPYKKTSGYAKRGIIGRSGKKYMPNPLGALQDDVWDIPIINPLAKERLAYPTQKPEALLERIIKISTNPGSIVLDCFMGSGTTQAVAMKLGRRFIGSDINAGAIHTAASRLNSIIAEKKAERNKNGAGEQLYLNLEIYNINNYSIFRNPAQARDAIIQALKIDRLPFPGIFDGIRDGYKVKIMPVNRAATRQDLIPLINALNCHEKNVRDEKRSNAAAQKIMLVCMGHEPDLADNLKMELGADGNVDIRIVDILDEKEWGHMFKADCSAKIVIEDNELIIKGFVPRDLLRKLSMPEENVEEWRELVESVAIDWNYTGDVLRPAVLDCPPKNGLVKGRYKLPSDYGCIRIKITDLLSESFETTIESPG